MLQFQEAMKIISRKQTYSGPVENLGKSFLVKTSKRLLAINPLMPGGNKKVIHIWRKALSDKFGRVLNNPLLVTGSREFYICKILGKNN